LAVPGFQEFMLPMLSLMGDGKERSIAEMYSAMAEALDVSPEDQTQSLASGRQTRFENRVGWAKTYLGKAGLLVSPRRGFAVITARGRDVLDDPPTRIDITFLSKFPEFAEFRQATSQNAVIETSVTLVESPEERLDSAYAQLKAGLVQELIQEMKAVPPVLFEKLVLELLLRMGYGRTVDSGIHLGKAGDEGIDAVINEDKLGLDVIYVQAKRWENPVGRPTIQAFAGSLEGQRANKGVVLTTSRFTPDAYDFVSKIAKRIILIDGARIAELMIEHKLGVQVVSTYENLKVDRDFFSGEANSAAE
jgi:restriction system protein